MTRAKGTILVCDLNAITAAERVRHEAISRDLFGAVLEVRKMEGGYAFRLPGEADVFRKIAEWIPNERACCPFLKFGVSTGPGHSDVHLELTGPPGTRTFLEDELGLDQEPVPVRREAT